jgi:membrane-associated phospholipid phosphatase
MSGVSTRVWVLLLLLSFCDIAWAAMRAISVSDWWPVIVVGAALLGIAIGYRRFGMSPRLAAIAEWTLLWIIFSVSGALLTYLAAANGGPLYDAKLAALDAELGFDWRAWFDFVGVHPLLRLALAAAYHSHLPQICFSVLWLSYLGWDHRNAELLTNLTLALVLTTAVFWLYPTLGPCVGLPECQDAYVDDLLGLRSGTLPSIDVMLLKGVIAFPSFHAVMATLFTYAHRRSASFPFVAAVNLVMLVSIPSEGGHYLVDVAGGLIVGGAAILAARLLPSKEPALAPATTA